MESAELDSNAPLHLSVTPNPSVPPAVNPTAGEPGPSKIPPSLPPQELRPSQPPRSQPREEEEPAAEFHEEEESTDDGRRDFHPRPASAVQRHNVAQGSSAIAGISNAPSITSTSGPSQPTGSGGYDVDIGDDGHVIRR